VGWRKGGGVGAVGKAVGWGGVGAAFAGCVGRGLWRGVGV